MEAGERLKNAGENGALHILRSTARPGVLLLMAWLRPDRVAEAIAGSGEGLVLVAEDSAGELAKHAGTARVRSVAKGEVSEEEQRAALLAHLERDGWLLSLEGALVAAAGWRLLQGSDGKAATVSVESSEQTVLVVDFTSPLSETAEIARLLGVQVAVKLPARTRVGGIITPQ
jgi:hypothetical protein